jgi:lipopolysaccharide/colanic/teichoic acid biosynthesis glycosyltransferase
MATSLVEIGVRKPEAPPANVLRFRPLRRSTDRLEPKPTVSYVQPVEASFHEEYHTSIATPQGTDQKTRVLNIVVAAIGLVLTAPLMVIIALAIRLSGKGPVFYTQTRIGLDRRAGKAPSHEDSRINDLGGKPFTMYKFRTMVTAAEHDAKEVWATPEDNRVTTVGKLLRVTRLDELPQLWNVLAGDMNIVGPRPERPTIFAELRVAIPHYHLRQRVRPGITGWAQINQPYDTCVDDVRRKIEFDLEYVRTRSVTRDISIMARTVPIMVSGKLGW